MTKRIQMPRAAVPYVPDDAVPPGRTLQETIDSLGLDQRELAERTGLSVKHINQVIKGVATLTPDTAIRLERVTGVSATLWNNLEANYQTQQTRAAQRSHAQTPTGETPTETELERLLDAEFYLPYAHSFLYQRLRTEARRVIDRYLSTYRDDLFRVWETERPFELHLDGAIVTGRADVILDREGGGIGSLALVDYKTAADPRTNDVYAFQLAIYAAAGRGEGLNVRAAYVHDLKESERVTVPTVIYILMRHGHDPEEAIVWAVNDAKDNDTLAAIVGAAVGALHGQNGLPARWIDNLLGRTTDSDDGRVFELLEVAQGNWWRAA